MNSSSAYLRKLNPTRKHKNKMMMESKGKDVVQWLRAFVVLAKDPGSIPSAYTVYNSRSRESDAWV